MPSSSHKKRRLKKSSRRSIPTIDRISELPDSILCHILYFLPTKRAATTSVLSKRWKLLWLSVLAIIFDSRDFKTSDLFLRVLYSTMYRRETTLPIYSFVIKSDANSSFVIQKDVNQFVYHVLQRGIQNFYLNLSKKSRKIIELPATILSSRTLKFLKLRNLTVGDISQVDLYLPSLKTLYLHKVEFGCHEHLMKLLSSCPILENLEITKRCFMNSLKNRFLVDYVALPNLMKAMITELYIPLNMVCKAEALRIELWRIPCRTKLLPIFESLTHLEISLFSRIWYPRWKWLLGMLKISPKLKILIIQDNKVLEETIDECWKDPQIVPECLSSQLKVCHIRAFNDTKYDLEFAKYIMESSKVLEIMAINSISSLDINVKYQLLMKLSSFKRGSTTCELLFN